jgi:hypothetical protein
MTPLSVHVVFYATRWRMIPREKSSMNARRRMHARCKKPRQRWSVSPKIDSNLATRIFLTWAFRRESTKAGTMRIANKAKDVTKTMWTDQSLGILSQS